MHISAFLGTPTSGHTLRFVSAVFQYAVAVLDRRPRLYFCRELLSQPPHSPAPGSSSPRPFAFLPTSARIPTRCSMTPLRWRFWCPNCKWSSVEPDGRWQVAASSRSKPHLWILRNIMTDLRRLGKGDNAEAEPVSLACHLRATIQEVIASPC